jgi:hypothetical protein
MKKIIFLLITFFIISCGGNKKTINQPINNNPKFEEVPANCRGISSKKITHQQIESGLLVMVKTNGMVAISPASDTNNESFMVKDGGLVIDRITDASKTIVFGGAKDPNFPIVSTSPFPEGACPNHINVQFNGGEIIYTLTFDLYGGVYIPRIDQENAREVVIDGLYRTKDALTGQVLYIQNKSFYLSTIYVLERQKNTPYIYAEGEPSPNKN